MTACRVWMASRRRFAAARWRFAHRAARSALAVELLLVAIASASACSEPSHGPSVGGNTNWLLACSDDAECGEQTSCICGRCSTACDRASGCAEFPGSTCAESVAARQQCGGEQTAGVCLLACEGDADCDSELACVQGACVERAQPTRCDDHPDALFCSGFDDAALPEWSLSAPPQSTLATTTRHRHAGPSSLEARASGDFSRSRYVGEFPVQRSGTLHLRVWMFVEPDTVLANLHVITIGDVDTGDWGVSLEFFEGAQAVETPTVLPVGEGVAIPEGRWFCMRSEIELSDSDGAVRVWLDEQQAARLTGVDTLPAAGSHNLTAGIDHSAQEEHASVFFDELLLETVPVSCGN
jgi:hypothetical protein